MFLGIKKLLKAETLPEASIHLPLKSNCDDALNKLKDNYDVTSEIREQREFLPKLTMFDIDKEHYKNSNKADLKTAIINKNPMIKSQIDNGKSFEILFITHDGSNSGSKAVIKLHPDIPQIIKHHKYKIFVDCGVCRISDRFFLNQ